eukprot:TRINITY_DN12782_c0_g1_i2.p1 TRINITY_DN12782_c0_g1~~TRINITY_DN12782_c0_g1_i2.p1  ORF type:complete len:245 (+),score=17.61 TRINITY_DN12782_c0_g1_i2:269-1003(+)
MENKPRIKGLRETRVKITTVKSGPINQLDESKENSPLLNLRKTRNNCNFVSLRARLISLASSQVKNTCGDFSPMRSGAPLDFSACLMNSNSPLIFSRNHAGSPVNGHRGSISLDKSQDNGQSPNMSRIPGMSMFSRSILSGQSFDCDVSSPINASSFLKNDIILKDLKFPDSPIIEAKCETKPKIEKASSGMDKCKLFLEETSTESPTNLLLNDEPPPTLNKKDRIRSRSIHRVRTTFPIANRN